MERIIKWPKNAKCPVIAGSLLYVGLCDNVYKHDSCNDLYGKKRGGGIHMTPYYAYHRTNFPLVSKVRVKYKLQILLE